MIVRVVADDTKDRAVVGHALHSLLYTMLTHYRLAEAVRLVELVIQLRDVRQLAAAYKMSDGAVADLLACHCEVRLSHVWTFFL